jgi:hypothetical protein
MIRFGMFLPIWLACGEEPNVSAVSTVAEVADVSAEVDATVQKEIQQGPLLVTTVLTPDTVRLGDPFELTLSVESTETVEVEMPPFGEALGRLTIVDFTPRQSSKESDGVQHTVYSQTYGLQPNRSGEVVIPSLRVGYRVDVDSDWEEVLTEPIPVQITSILPTDGDLVYQNARMRLGALPVEQPWIPWALGGAVLCTVLAVGIWWMRRRTVLETQLSAYEQASRQLKQLQDELSTVQLDALDSIYAGLSSALRGYLEGRFGVSALEQTTEELRQSLPTCLRSHSTVVSKKDIETILVFLAQCDAVKFAGQRFDVTDAQARLVQVRTLIDQIHKDSLHSQTHSEPSDPSDPSKRSKRSTEVHDGTV